VQVVLDNPVSSGDDGGVSELASSLVSQRSGTQEWHWRASFEAFDAYPRADVPGGQVPAGSYRFVVEGHFNDGHTDPCADDTAPRDATGAVTSPITIGSCYRLASAAFQVRPWTGVTVHDLQRNGGQVSFTVDDSYPQLPQDTAGIRFYQPQDHPHLGLCTTCTFRPWASAGTVTSATVEVHDATGAVYDVAASRDDTTGTWVAAVPDDPGVSFLVPAGGVVDSYGESNGQPAYPANG
jgi:hypothetical protein